VPKVDHLVETGTEKIVSGHHFSHNFSQLPEGIIVIPRGYSGGKIVALPLGKRDGWVLQGRLYTAISPRATTVMMMVMYFAMSRHLKTRLRGTCDFQIAAVYPSKKKTLSITKIVKTNGIYAQASKNRHGSNYV
jgi:hypothetical protein